MAQSFAQSFGDVDAKLQHCLQGQTSLMRELQVADDDGQTRHYVVHYGYVQAPLVERARAFQDTRAMTFFRALVELKLVRGRLTVTAKGPVKRDGAPGDVIPAENVATGARLTARVQEDGTLLVVRGAMPARRR